MSINDLLGEPTPGPPPRLTPRAPLSVKELTAILILGALVWGAYERLSHFADKTAVEQISTAQWQMRLDVTHQLDVLNAKVDKLVDVKAAPDPKRKP